MLCEVLLPFSSNNTAAAPATKARPNGPTGLSLDGFLNSLSGTHYPQSMETYSKSSEDFACKLGRNWAHAQTFPPCGPITMQSWVLGLRRRKHFPFPGSSKPAGLANAHPELEGGVCVECVCAELSGAEGGEWAGAQGVWPVSAWEERKEEVLSSGCRNVPVWKPGSGCFEAEAGALGADSVRPRPEAKEPASRWLTHTGHPPPP